ncbi:SusE domain-containing protein [Saccharicrinis sp. 156]|uniref:SusE domain-containing protein n=1 Tax=Saccharicrinis sp. 156 TaxID=3417574 RepID=UPI003D339D62
MKKYYILLFALVGVLGFFTSCEKDGDSPVMRENVIAPAITTMPDLTLVRANGANNVIFKCSEVDPGFNASASYFLEACPAGNNFQDVIQVYNGITCEEITMTVSALNNILLDGFPEDMTSSVDFRIRCVLETDAGAGVEDLEFISATVTADATIFGLLRLDVIITGATESQKIVSPASDGNYEGFVKFNAGDTFTLLDPDNNITYGGGSGNLVVDGAAIAVADASWYKLSADVNGLAFVNEAYSMGLVGSATPNGWDGPDQPMNYDAAEGTWSITLNLISGMIKFRLNNSWSWNMGHVEGEEPGMSGNTQQGGVGNDIPISEDGNYTIIFKVLSDDAGTYEIIKN